MYYQLERYSVCLHYVFPVLSKLILALRYYFSFLAGCIEEAFNIKSPKALMRLYYPREFPGIWGVLLNNL